ncbi:MAG: PilZ domain-containing protein [Nitrospirae bacterium]|nr:PilZ domain-containing protein [Nitrospirota bacterium]
MSPEKRQSQRSDAFLIVEFRPLNKSAIYLQGITSNLSNEGFSLDSQGFDFKIGEALECRLKHPYIDFSVSAIGEIVWRKDSWYNCIAGIKFIEIDEEAKNNITDFINTDKHKHVGSSLDKEADVSIMQKDQEQKDTGQKGDLFFNAIQRNNKDALKPHDTSDKKTESESFDKPETEKTVSAMTSDIKVKEDQDKWVPHDNRSKVYRDIHTAYAGKRKINRVYIPVVTIVVIIAAVTLFLTHDNSQKGAKNITPPHVDSASPQQTVKDRPLTSPDEAKPDSLSVQKLTESARPRTLKIQESNKEGTDQPIANSTQNDIYKDKHESPAVDIQTNNTALQELPKSERLLTSNYMDEFAKIADRKDTNSEGVILNIPEKTEGEIKPGSDSKTEPVTEAKVQSTPDAGPVLQNIKTDSNVEINKTKPPVSSVPQEHFIVFEELFNKNTNNWDIFDTNMASAQIKGGEYLIENKRKKGPHIMFYPYDFPVALNLITEVSIRAVRSAGGYSYGLLVKSPDKHAYGLVFGAKDALNNYTFQIRENGFYSISKYKNGVLQELSSGKIKDTAYNQNASNILKIVRQGNNTRFFINDNFIDEISNLSFFGNKAGFIVDGESKIAVNKIRTQIQ